MISVIERYPHLHKISFIGHSLGGLIARYAIALLYGRNFLTRLPKVSGTAGNNRSGDILHEEKYIGKIAGLEPINFITCATPHLGSRGHKQVTICVYCHYASISFLHFLPLSVLSFFKKVLFDCVVIKEIAMC